MTHHGNQHEKLLAALDVCRPGSSDLTDQAELAEAAAQVAGDPQAAQLRERVERLDRQIRQALDDVPMPEGLADRLIDRLEDRRQSAVGSRQLEAEPARRVNRRWAIAGGLTAAAAMVLVAVVGFWPAPKQPLSSEQALERAITLFVERPHDAPPGKPLQSAPADLPPSGQLHIDRQTTWRELPDVLPERTVAYDLSLPHRPDARATLLVTTAEVQGIPYSPPPTPMRDTRGVCASIWRTGELTYILVVEGGHHDYRSLLRDGGGMLTWRFGSLKAELAAR